MRETRTSSPVLKPSRERRFSTIAAALCALVAGVISFVWFARGIAREPHFMDESAYLSQTFYASLFFEGRVNDVAWVEYPAIDLPPLTKYSLGLALDAAGAGRPPRSSARLWYIDNHGIPESRAMLFAGRLSSALWGALGVAAIAVLGTLLSGRLCAGALAAGLLAANPLYRLHARRAMADAPVEALMLLTLAFGLSLGIAVLRQSGWRVGRFALAIVTGCVAGLAVLAKLNGGLALVTLGAWTLLGLFARGTPAARKVELVLCFCVVAATALAAFCILNPTVYAQPAAALPEALESFKKLSAFERLFAIVDHRAKVASVSADRFPEAIHGLSEKLGAFFIQGFGRFSPLGPAHTKSWIRYDSHQDWGAAVWLPLSLAGIAVAGALGRRQAQDGELPLSYCLVIQTLAAWLVVGSFLPLAWDRYFLSIQASSALLVGLAASAAGGLAAQTVRRVS